MHTSPMNKKNIILGAGVAGLGAAYGSGFQIPLYEAAHEPGGMCGNFRIGEFLFDKAVHLSFTKNELVRHIQGHTPHHVYHPYPINWYQDRWIKHPVQNNLHALDVSARIQAILSFFNRPREMKKDNFAEWSRTHYGEWLCEHFIFPYNKKYWCTDLEQLSTSWIGNRLYQPSEKEFLEGCFLEETPNTYYAQEMLYPKEGGFINLWKECIDRAQIFTNYKAIKIDPYERKVFFSNGDIIYYENLYSSIPLVELIKLLTIDIDQEIMGSVKKLEWTSVALISVGFNTQISFKNIWFYIYDVDVLAARAYSPSEKSPENAPLGKSSLQFELYFHKNDFLDRQKALKSIEKFMIKQNWGKNVAFVDYRIEPYANVIMNKDIDICRENIAKFLKNFSIHLMGRFGSWNYLWSDQAFISGVSAI